MNDVKRYPVLLYGHPKHVVLASDYDALAAKAERYIQEGISLADQRDALAADNKRLREALADLLDRPAQVVQATVPPYQVVLDVSVPLTRWNNAKAALAGSKEVGDE